ncbi:heme exporter protein CcmD [Aestuariivirga litoralis]|nr:heme exporter protein CcmD [Aestuariivirga litoralis]MBG1233659.1 heme exporter protein CcmD [Aestuariivirga litoralis]
MDWLAHNSGFVIAAYAISGICLVALVIGVVGLDRQRARALKNQKN